MKRFLAILGFALLLAGSASGKEVYDINRDWKFFTYNEKDSLIVNLPHTWSADALNGRKDYYRGIGNYLKYIDIKPQWRHKRIFVKFYGASNVTGLMINGRFIEEHKGGNNAFVFEITGHVDFNGRNLFWVVVNNAGRTDVLPTAGSENVYGGLFRKAELIISDVISIGPDDFGSDGVMFRTTRLSEQKAEGMVNVKLNSAYSRQVKLDLEIRDAEGNVVCQNGVKPKTEQGISDVGIPFEINDPVLWHGTENPYLYDVIVTLTDGNYEDMVSFRTGLRSFSASASKGFTLNGKPYPIRGVVLYRDRAGYGPVANQRQLREDVDLIREMGANAVRVAGGTHSQEFYDICDQRGLIVLNDSPLVGATILETKGFYDKEDFRENGKKQFKEMIYQCYNHPSVVFWGVFSEPELRGDDPIPYIRELNSIAKALDPARITVGVSNKDGEVNTITDLIVWNHTFGWVEGHPTDIGVWRDQIHADPVWNKVGSAVSWRCGGSVNQQDENPGRIKLYSNWHPEGWQTYLHETYMRILGGDQGFWALFPGNMFDYGSVRYAFGEGGGVNDCGLVTFDRQIKKDAFYLYKAKWNREELFVHITGKRNDLRSARNQTIKVYSNAEEVDLLINGISAGTRKGTRGVFTWENVRLEEGGNEIYALGDFVLEDRAVITVDKQRLFR